jgi:hypothetical protein
VTTYAIIGVLVCGLAALVYVLARVSRSAGVEQGIKKVNDEQARVNEKAGKIVNEIKSRPADSNHTTNIQL